MAIAYAANGMTAEAVAEITKGFEASRRHPSILSGMAYFHAINGDQERAQDFLRQALEARETAYIPAVEIAAAYAGFRDRQQTLAWLEKALEERSIQLFFVNMDCRARPAGCSRRRFLARSTVRACAGGAPACHWSRDCIGAG